MSNSEDQILSDVEADGDDLFGGADDDGVDVASSGAQSPQGRALSDDSLESDDDMRHRRAPRPNRGGEADLVDDEDDYGRSPRGIGEADDAAELDDTTLGIELYSYRHRIPKPMDGRLRSLRVPHFIKFDPVEYRSEAWEPTGWDLKNAQATNAKAVVRYRRDRSTGQMQSNTNICRWSDGSISLIVGDEHFELQHKPMVPKGRGGHNETRDAHYYAAAAHLCSNALQMVGHVTDEYSVRTNTDYDDEAVAILVSKLKAAQPATVNDIIITTRQDPELQMRQAEQAEKDRMRAQRRRETAAARMDGLGRNRTGMTAHDLEGGAARRAAGASGSSRKRAGAGAAKTKRPRADYDSDDELQGASGRRNGGDYDRGDGFVVDSDEEDDEGGQEYDGEDDDILDDVDEEEDYDDEDEALSRSRSRSRSQKQHKSSRSAKRRKMSHSDEDMGHGGDGDDDDDEGDALIAGRSGQPRRPIVDDDDED